MFCTECISSSHVCKVCFFFYEGILLNRHTQYISSYFLFVKSPASQILTSLALSSIVMEQTVELVSVLRRINFMTPRVLSFPLLIINGLYFMKR